MDDFEVPFAAYSALFRAVNSSMFINNKLSNKIVWMNNGNDANMDIFNEERLKSILFKEIKSLYNDRINFHNLKLTRLSDGDINNFLIERFCLVDDNNRAHSGLYEIFPKTFRCEKCDDFRIFRDDKEWAKFDANKCRVPGCGGSYTQVPFVGFCETCGEISSIFHNCNEHGHDHLKLIRKDINAPGTWQIRCTSCGEEMDMMNFCNHRKHTLSDKDITKLKPINVNQGGIFRSIVKTTIDIADYEESKDIDIILLGAYLHYWDKYFDEDDLTDDEIIEDIIYYLSQLDMYPTEKDRKKAIRRNIDSSIFEKGENIKKDIAALKEEYDFSYSELNDYFILKKRFSEDEENQNIDFYDIIKDDEKSLKEYVKFKREIGIEEVTYIPDIHIISSSIGVIKGINRSDENVAPHFEPHWKSQKDKDTFRAFSFPFETEGIMFDLDKEKLVEWIFDNSDKEWDRNISAEEFLFNLNEDSVEYGNLKTLIHTFAHILINRSSLYTGLNSDSCGELLFPKAGSFLIYSTSNINIGGFSFVFENSLFEWFNNVKLEVTDCVFDPTCIDEHGACFSCVYLPEFVCSHFNDFLDRDVFLGENRYNKGYWK
ncbi:hypothetical protein [uncultured Methanobrevibacter sp.]|uniref:hypothetical protein n=1 Tax=uncultured Methanobrevibacter sp. TaxID=253161 RepID=UPI0025DF0A13|nr:hypothetical protein [uncultured Methanobrevibacter sp.]